MDATLRIEGSEFNLLTIFEALVRIDEHYLRANPETPEIYSAGVEYIRRVNKPELWPDVPFIRKAGGHDCDGLACWRCAELRIAGYNAHVILRRYGPNLYHALVEVVLPDKRVVYDDPSARLGMFDKTGGASIAGVPAELWSPMPGSPEPASVIPAHGSVETLRLRRFVAENGEWVSDPALPAVHAAVRGEAMTGRIVRDEVPVERLRPQPQPPRRLRRIAVVDPESIR